MAEAEASARGTLLYVVTEDWFFASHFLPMARTARDLGFEVAVATRVTSHGEALAAEGLRVIPVDFDRRGNAPAVLRRQIAAMTELIERERPSLVHCIALRSVVVGGFAASRAGAPAIYAITGLGHLWATGGFGAWIGRRLVRRWIRQLRRPGGMFLFENHEDPATLGLPADAANVAFVPGAGVDPDEFPAQPAPPEGPLKAALVGRMLWAKGIDSAVEAVSRARAGGADITLDLWGEPDPGNPASISESQLRAWDSQSGIRWHGRANDVRAVWRDAHIALAPSRYREGVPRAIVEAMASARPVITSDIPGCREIVRNGVEGLVVAKDDVEALAFAITTLAGDVALRQRMGAAARQRFEEGYTVAAVTERIAKLYRAIASR